jgi:hypothetical protein
MYRTLWSHCPTWHVTISWHWYAPNIMKPLFYMTPYNILTLICTKHYETTVLHDKSKYHDAEVYQTLWSHCSTLHITLSWHWCVPNIMKPLFTWHVTISWRWCVPNIMNSLLYMTRYNIMTLMCTKHYEAIVLHDTLQYHDADVYQTLWIHCSTWHVTISW